VTLGAELLFMVVLGPLLLGPKRLHTIQGHLARAKASFDVASRSFSSQITADSEAKIATAEPTRPMNR
jgi:Sec-independent protein translocase protein TatA